MKIKVSRLLAYVYMPVIFTIVGIAILYIALKPVVEVAAAVGSMVIADDLPNFSTDLESIFVKPEFKEEHQPETINKSDIVWPSYGEHYAKISCDRIGLNENLYMGDSASILRAGVGQYHASFPPGYGKRILLAGHCTTYFASLENIKANDIVTITTSYGIYKYKIMSVKIVDPPFNQAYNISEDKEQLVMYTCYPFTLLSASRNQRLFVYGDKISGPRIIDDLN